MLHPSPPSSISSSRSGSTHSRLSFLSTSSDSTFSDFSVCSLPSPPASGSKTHAFFASPFPTRPPSPTPPPTTFFSVPVIDVSTPKITTPTPTFDSNEPTPRPKDLQPASLSLSDDEPCAGSIIASSPTTLRLLKPLGHGAFSSVWLADDLSPVPLVLRSRRSLHSLRRQASLRAKSTSASPRSAKSPPPSLSLSRAGSLRKLRARVPGTRPMLSLDSQNDAVDEFGAMREEGVLTSSLSRASSTSSSSSSYVPRTRPPAIAIVEPVSPPPTPPPPSSLSRSPSAAKGRMVAVKMTVRGGAVGSAGDEDAEREKEKERTRVAFVREVEVLRHISHPNITPLLTHLSTPTHHVLVLPFLPGGDLLALVNTDTAWSRLRETVLQRMWCELCRAVAWMHSVGLVHRDIKLENILLTTPTYTTLTPTSRAPTLADLPLPPAPLVKLTDFGLSRFVDIRSAEERARDRRARRAGVGRGVEDDNDKGAEDEDEDEEEEEDDSGPLLSTRCGSEAYAAPELVMGGAGAGAHTRAEPSPPLSPHPNRNPKQRGVYDARETDAWACGVVLYALVGRRLPFGEGVGVGGGITRGRMARRAWLMRIARGEYEWPDAPAGAGAGGGGEAELVGPTLARSEGARRIVGRLLVRDPRRRARVGGLWGDVWMGGEGVVESPGEGSEWAQRLDGEEGEVGEQEVGEEEGEEEEMGEEELEEALREAEEEVETGGWLVDQEGIGDVARREVV